MLKKWCNQRYLGMLAAPLMLVGVLAGLGPGTAAAVTTPCESWAGTQPPSPGTADNGLSGVTVLSACNAWAVGAAGGGSGNQALIEHWNGATWTVTPIPSFGVSSTLLGVHAVSPVSIWAVGNFDNGNGVQPLILHWDGNAWTQQNTAVTSGELSAVRAVSNNDVWAVGDFASPQQGLILHWDGTQWSQVKSPSFKPSSLLFGVTATSRTNAWAVGEVTVTADIARPHHLQGRAGQHLAATTSTLMEHWNGTAWSRVTSPSPNGFALLNGISATSASDAWAVGVTSAGTSEQTLALHWNGQAWAQVTTPSPGGSTNDNTLEGVAATAANNAWAVGQSGPTGNQTLILQWNGSTWSTVNSPNPGTGINGLFGVAATSADDAWAVGSFDSGAVPLQALGIHCC